MAVPATSRGPWAVLALVSLAVFAVFLDTTVLFVAFPAIAESFPRVDAAGLSWVLNAYTIVFAALLVPAGRLADRIGRRRTFLFAVSVFTAASVLCGLAPTPGLLVAARVLQAVGAAGLIPSSLALVLRAFPRPKVPVAVAIWGAVGAVAGAVGPTLGAALVEGPGWRWVFFANVPVGAVAWVGGRRVLSESAERHPGPVPDPAGVVVLVAGMALLALGLVQSDTWGWASASTWAALGGGILAVAVFTWRSARVAAPVLDLSLFGIRSFRWANAATMAFAVGFTAMFFGNVLFLTRAWDWSVLTAGLAITPGPALVAVLAPVAGRLAARYGQRPLLVPGGLVFASGALWLLARATAEPDFLGVWLPGTLLTGLGVALCLPQLSSAAVQGLPPDRFASGSAVNQAIRQLGGTLGVALVVAFVGSSVAGELLGRFERVWWLIVASGISVTALSLPLHRRPAVAPTSPDAPALPGGDPAGDGPEAVGTRP